MTRSQLKRMLIPQLRSMTKGQRVALLRKRARIRYPFRAESAFASRLSKLYSVYTQKVLSFFSTKKPLYAIYSDLLRNDSFESEFEKYMNELSSSITEEGQIGLLNGISVESYVSKIMEYIKTFDEKEVETYFLKMFKMGLPYSDTWWQGLKQQLTQEFLIRASSTIKDYLEQVKEIVAEGVRNEVPFDKLVEQIQSVSSSLTLKKAQFLARDLTGKINGLFTKNLHSALGLPYYLWTSAYDERVRGRPGGVYADAPVDHWSMDDKLGSWSDPTIYSPDYGKTFVPKTGNMVRLHPGMDWACRCIAAPWIQDIIIEVDREIRGGYYGTD